jgi:adenylate cyclase
MEIVPEENGIRLQMAGCEKDCFCGRPCELVGDCHLDLPARFSIGDTRFEVADHTPIRSKPPQELAVLEAERLNRSPSPTIKGPSPATLSRWFEALGTLHRWASSSQEFFVQAARCAVEAIGLDGAVVLRRRDESWEIAASYLPHPELGIHCNMAALDQLVETPRTLFHGTLRADAGDEHAAADQDLDGVAELREALATLQMDFPHRASDSLGPPRETDVNDVAVVVAPLFNAAHELAGAIYGFRSVRAGNARRGIRYLEAHLIQLLAGAVTDNIVRLQREAEVDRRRVLMEQALAATQDQTRKRLASERREITLLFADLRRFSQITNSLSTQQTYELLADVMEALTAAVMDHDGMIIDYYGDGLAAMWNAPADQAEHPELACRAALRMLETLPAVNERWSDLLGDELRLGIGVHTGVAQLGNAGSSRRMKYGPRGTNVNLASRVEAATKAVGVPLLVTGPAAARLSNRLATYRLCRVQLPGISESVELFGVRQPSLERPVLAQLADYERALKSFEQGQLDDAAGWLAKLESAVSWIPAKFLAQQIELARGERQGRRSTDRPTLPGPIITLHVK